MKSNGNKKRVAVCVATCRRPRLLEKTLESLREAVFVDAPVEMEVFVGENDTAREGEPVVERIRGSFPWPLHYLVEERRGIPFVRNRLLEEVKAFERVAFIDDDETADPGWLSALSSVMDETGAEIVLGPVVPKFEDPSSRWLEPFFEGVRHRTYEKVESRYFKTGNVLLAMGVLADLDGPFDPAFALTGGSDGHLGRVLEGSGVTFVWCDEAVVRETIPSTRARPGWFLKRRFRTGVGLARTWSMVDGLPMGIARSLYHTVAAGSHGALLVAASPILGRKAALRGAGHFASSLGTALGIVGVRYSEYDVIHGG